MKINEKGLRWLFLAIVTVSFCVNYAALFDKKLDSNGDNYHYYLLARSLSQGNGYVSDIGPEPTPHMHFPPGYPAFLSLFLRLFPDNIVAMKLLNGLLLLASIFLLFRIVRKSTGKYGLWYALAACLLCTFHGDLLRWGTILMSEMLYLAISLGIIALCQDLDLEKVRGKDFRHILRLVGICLLAAAAYLVRTIGVSIILAVALAFFVLAIKAFRRRKTESGRWMTPLLACCLVVLTFLAVRGGWNLRNQRVMPGWRSDYLSSFELPSSDEAQPAAFWADRIGKNLQSFVSYYIPLSVLNPGKTQLSPEPDRSKGAGWTIGILAIALMVIGFLSMKGLQWLILSYVVITFGVLILYPPQFADIRYFVPLLPLMLAALVTGVGRIAEWIVEKKNRRVAWLPVAVAAVLTVVLLPVFRSGQRTYRTMASYKSFAGVPAAGPYQDLIDACVACRSLPKDQVAAVLKPEIFYYHSRYHHAVPIPRTGTPEETIRYLDENGVDIVILDSWFPTAYRQFTPVIEQYPTRFSVLQQVGNPNRPVIVLGYR